LRQTPATGLILGFLALSALARAQSAAEVPRTAGTDAVAADDPQVAADQQQQEAHRPGLVKRAIRSFLSDDATRSGRGLHLGPFFPQIDVVSSGGGLAPLLQFWVPDIGETPLDVQASASYSIYSYQYYDLQVGLVPHDGERLPRVERGSSALFPLSDLEKTAAAPGFGIYASARYRDYPREDFYGVGPTSLRLDHTDYRLQEELYEGIVRYRVEHLSLMGRAGLLQTSIRRGTDPAFPDTGTSNDEGTAPGLLRSPDFVHLSVGGWLELRDEPGNPHRGAAVGVSFSRFDDRRGHAFQFNRTIVDGREYIPLGGNRHVVALRQVTSLDDPDAGSSVPFYMQSTLGGGKLLRGYDSFRFRDDKLLALAGEYRFELIPKIELALVYETGKVFPTMREFDFRHLRHTFGAGIRLKSPRNVHLRLDVMHGPEGTRVQLRLKPSF
jgi:hypothetical protein